MTTIGIRKAMTFRKMVSATAEAGKGAEKPVIIHSREAAADTMELLKANYHGEMPMVMHCYSYSPEMAREYRKMGLYLGIGGVLTFKNAKKLKETVLESPMEYLLGDRLPVSGTGA